MAINLFASRAAAALAIFFFTGALAQAAAPPPLAADSRELGRSAAAAALCGFASDKEASKASGFQLAANIQEDGSIGAAEALIPPFAQGRAEFETEFRSASAERIAELCSFSWLHWSSFGSLPLPEAQFSGGQDKASELAGAAGAAHGAIHACQRSEPPALGGQAAKALGLLALSSEGSQSLGAAHAEWVKGAARGFKLASGDPLACPRARAAALRLEAALAGAPDLPVLLRLARMLRIRQLGPWT